MNLFNREHKTKWISINSLKELAKWKSNMSKEEMLESILQILKAQPSVTESADIMSESTRDKFENSVYTKKVEINIDESDFVPSDVNEIIRSLKDIKYVSITSDNEDFEHTSTNDIRINCVDRYNNWVNVFADNYSVKYIEVLYNLIKYFVELRDGTFQKKIKSLEASISVQDLLKKILEKGTQIAEKVNSEDINKINIEELEKAYKHLEKSLI